MTAAARHAEQRHHHYLDARVQLQAMVVLAALESALVAVALWLLHGRLRDAIEQSLYSVHLAADEATFPMLLDAALPVLAVFVVVNFVAVVLAVQVWVQQVEHVLLAFGGRLAHIAVLDLRPQAIRGEPRHAVLGHAERWQQRERTRLAGLRALAADLDAGAEREQLRATLARMRALLHGEASAATRTAG